MRNSRLLIIIAILGSALMLLLIGFRQIAALEKERARVHERIAHLLAKIEVARMEMTAREKGAEQARSLRSSAVHLLARERAKRTENSAEGDWAEPPRSWPSWQGDSPFVWIDKQTLKELPVTPFHANGSISRRFAAMLALSNEQQQGLNLALTSIVAEYQELEAAQARSVTNHLERGEGKKVTIVVEADPEGSSRLQSRFDATLRNHLTPQQFEIVKELGFSWLSQNLRTEENKPKIFSVSRSAAGTYGITIKRGDQWMSTSGTTRLETYLPKHLLPLFEDLLAEPDSSPAPE